MKSHTVMVVHVVDFYYEFVEKIRRWTKKIQGSVSDL